MTAFELKSSLAQTKEWDAQELRSLEREGILKKCTKDTDHIALHPYWLSNPIQGIHEELDHRLGKWVQRFNGYLVTYKKIRRNSKTPAMINVDQPWVHVDVKGKFYIYQPAVDQVLRGTVTKLGTKAAVCVVLNLFSVTVHPGPNTHFDKWTCGDTELEFRVTSFRNRSKGPHIQATCTRILE